MKKKILTIVSGAPSGALNVAVMIANALKRDFQSDVLLRKYNLANLEKTVVVKDRLAIDYIWGLCRELDKNRPDLIMVHGYSTHLWTKVAAAIKGIPVIHIEHNVEKYTPFRRWVLKQTDRYTNQYICVSKGVASHLLAQGADPAKVSVIYNGIDAERFKVQKTPQERFTIGMTARFSSQKDHLTLIKAVQHLTQEKKLPVQLLLQGTGKQKEKCERYVAEHNLQTVVTFTTGQLTELAARSDLFVLATHYEGFGLVVCEAMAAGLPVIATNVPGVDEIIEHGHNGFLVPKGDVLSLSDQIAYCYAKQGHPDIQQIIENANNDLHSRFLIVQMTRAYQEVVAEVLGIK